MTLKHPLGVLLVAVNGFLTPVVTVAAVCDSVGWDPRGMTVAGAQACQRRGWNKAYWVLSTVKYDDWRSFTT